MVAVSLFYGRYIRTGWKMPFIAHR